MTYEHAVDYLYGRRMFGAKFGLENTRRLARVAGNPERDLRFIHVAGTNGKGSTCAFLENIYRGSGYRVGLFTSPHLVSFTERMQVDRVPISEADVALWTERLSGWIEKEFRADEGPTFFETVTVMAMLYFRECGCELVIWETGLGGRLDATNVVTPLASVITNVQRDHQQWLGDALEQIAWEKAGIIKPGVSAFTAAVGEDVLGVIRRVAGEQGAGLTELEEGAENSERSRGVVVALEGAHQRRNAALAIAVVRGLSAWLPVEETTILEGLRTVSWAGRFHRITRERGGVMVVDSAHNPDGLRTLTRGLEESYPGQRPCLILGILGDKDWGAMCELVSGCFDRIVIAPVVSERAVLPATLADALRVQRPTLRIECTQNVRDALEMTQGEPLTVVAGSMYLVGEVFGLMGISPCGAVGSTRNEIGLNEWHGARRV